MNRNQMRFSILNTLASAKPDPLTGGWLPADPWLCFADSGDEDESGGDEGDDEDEKDERTFTAEQMEKTIKRRIAKLQRSHKAELKEATKRAEGFEAQLAELTERIESGDKAEKRAESKLERELAKLTAQVAEKDELLTALTSERDGAKGSLRNYILRDKLSSALSKNGVLTKAQKHAVKLAIEEMGAELLEEDGEQVVVVKMGGAETDDLDAATKAWLKANPHFAAAGGTGTDDRNNPGPRGRVRKGPLSPEQIENADPLSLLTSGLAAAQDS